MGADIDGAASATVGVDGGTGEALKFAKNVSAGAPSSGLLHGHAHGPVIARSNSGHTITRKSTNASPFDTGDSSGHVGLAGTGPGFDLGLSAGIDEGDEEDTELPIPSATDNVGQSMSVSMPDLSISAGGLGIGAGAGVGAGVDDHVYAQPKVILPDASASLIGSIEAPDVSIDAGNVAAAAVAGVNFGMRPHKKPIPLPASASISLSAPTPSVSVSAAAPSLSVSAAAPSFSTSATGPLSGLSLNVSGSPSTSASLSAGVTTPKLQLKGPSASATGKIKVKGGVKVKKPNFFQRLLARFGGAKRRSASAGASLSGAVSTPALNISAEAPKTDVVSNKRSV